MKSPDRPACKYFLTILAFLLAQNLSGQTYNLRCKNIGIPEGLSNNHITDIIQDEYSYIWIATERGLNRYDGSEMINFPLSRDKGSDLYNNHIIDLENHIDGGMWIVTREDLLHYENGSFQQKRISEDQHIVINGVGTVAQENWFFTNEGVFRQLQDKSGFEKIEVSPRTNFKYSFINSADISTALFNPYTNELWICTATKGVYKKNLETGNIHAFSFNIEAGRADNNLYIHEALLDSTGNIWFAGPEGLWCKPKDRDDGLKIEFSGTAYMGNEVYSLELDRQENIWCAVADLGIILLNSQGEVFEHLDAENHNVSGLTSGFIRKLFIDDKNNVWAGHQEKGIDYFVTRYSRDIAYYKDIISVKGSVPTSVKKIVPLSRNEVLAVYESPSNPFISELTLLSTANGNNFSRPSGIQHISLNQTDLDFTEVLHFENQFAVSTYENLYMFNSEHLAANTPVINIHPETLSFDDHVMFHYLHKGTHWLLGQHLRTYDISKRCEAVYMEDLNLDRFVIDNNGILWGAASHNGLVIIDLQNRREIAQFINDPLASNSISDNNITCLYKDSNGYLWIGTEFGLNRIQQNVDSLATIHSGTDYPAGFDDLQFIRIQTQEGLSGNVIKSLIEDNQKRLWIATDEGISVLDLSDHTLHTLGFFDGIQEGSFLLNSCAKGEDGTLYFGGENGLNFFNPEHITFEKEAYSIYINRLDILKERISVGSEFRDKVILNTDLEKTSQIELSYQAKLIQLGFVAVDFEHPGEVEYFHMLDGFDIDWIKSLEGNSATYTKLRPGSYTFKVKARMINNSWTDETRLVIVVSPPFWASWWFIVLLSLLIVSLVFLYIRYRLSSLKSQKEKLEELVKKRTLELEQANAMKIRFFTNISHEIRTPLTLILAPIEHLINSKGIARSVQKKHALIYRNAQRLHDLINQLLQFRKIETGNLEFKPSFGEPIQFIEDLAAPFFDYASQRGQKFILDIQAEKIETWFDEDKLDKILTNLLSNAIKYTPKEGKITLKASTEFDNSGLNPILRLEVSDTGMGIDPAKLERIFDRFYEIDDSNLKMEGTGIGLALTKALVELYKGEITVSSRLGEGSCFSVKLPMGGSYLEEFRKNEEDTEEIIELPDGSSETYERKKGRASILIVEDNNDLCCFIQDLLSDDYNVQTAFNGKEALELLALDHNIDLVISDIMMPVMDGLTFCRNIKNNVDTSHIPVLLLTAKHGEEAEVEGLKAGADDYICKPFNEEILKIKIKNVLAFRENLRSAYVKQLKIEPSNITTTSRDKDFIEKAIRVVEESMSDTDFDIKTFASELAVSPSTLLRKMKAITGESSDKFIRTIRLKRAAQLLQSSQLSVTEICYEVGFSSQKHFSATFKKQFELSPSAYKKKFQEPDDQHKKNKVMKAIPNGGMLLVLFSISVLSACTRNSYNTDKTLVSWVTLNNLDAVGGSILTLQDGQLFDGIILSDKTSSWIAGSEEGKRSLKITNGSSVITPGVDEFEQIAVVYKGHEILIYKDAVLQAQYEAENINLLNSHRNMVIFGPSFYGGKGAVSGAIDDARIYSEALSEKELRKLQPNKSSGIKPYAWWDFEGDEVLDLTGRYEFHNLGVWEDVEIQSGKLILKEYDSQLIAARAYVPETPKWPENPPQNWPTYHLAHPGPGVAFPGDPNPAFYYKGRYHLHYIYENPYGFMFAHLSSSNMVNWEWQPTVLGPPKTGHGMFSGTGFFTMEGKPAMIYHGWGSDRNHIMFGLDDRLDEWTDPQVILPMDENGDEVKIEQWDPDCWQIGDTYYALSGGKDPGLLKSDNLKDWVYIGKLLHEDYPLKLDVDRYEDISCANIFQIGDKWMLLCISHGLGCRYYLGDFKNEKFAPEFHALMNWMAPDETPTGFAPDNKTLTYFAPESLETKDGRRVVWAWITADASPSGLQSLPRELDLPADGILRIRPLKELETLRFDQQTLENITVDKDEAFRLSDIRGDAIEMQVTFKAPLPEDFGIRLLGDENGEGGISITAGANRNTLSIGAITPPFKLKDGEDLSLRIFIDKNLVEVFANDRQAAAYANKEIRKNPGISFFTNDRALMIREVNTWKMKSAYGTNSN